MAGEITDVRNGIEARLKTISGLEVYDHTPDATTVTPSITIRRSGRTPNVTFGGASTPGDRIYNWILTLKLAGSIPQEQWQEIDSYEAPTGNKSIVFAIEGDGTLGGAAEWSVISPGEEIDAPDTESRGDGWFYVTEFPLETYVSG